MNAPVVAAFGAGTNSVAYLVGMHERGERPDLILFADTGEERPEVYWNSVAVSEWCLRVGFPPIVWVRKGGRQETLSQNCERMAMLPSIAYGFKGCSHKFKREPQDAYVNKWQPARDAWAAGLKVTKLIGYDAGEERRAKIAADDKYVYRYPLIEWGWDRDECVAAIARAGLPQPGGSACFFCPSSTRDEIDALKKEHPLLFRRALDMEIRAEPNLDTVAGLGRRFSWHEHEDGAFAAAFAKRASERYAAGRELAKASKRAESLIEAPCDCYDGGTA